jgi:mono/diheme cytochrome c family protein
MLRRLLTLAFLLTGADALASERGETLIRRHCGGCHAIGALDSSPEPAAPPLRDLNRRYEPEMLGEALGEGLLSGHPLMPEFRFEPDDVEAILEFLKSIQVRQPAGIGVTPAGGAR